MVALVAACGGGAAAPRPAPEVAAPAVARARPFVIARGAAIGAIARDDAYLYWADADGLQRRRLGGPDAGAVEPLAAWPQVIALDVDGDRVYASDGAAIQWVPATGGDLRPVADGLDRVIGLDADGGELFVALDDAIARIGGDGAPPVMLATGAVRVMDLAVSPDHVYWTDYGEDPDAVDLAQIDYLGARGAPGPGSVHRVSRRGGDDELIATDQRGPSGIAVAGGRLWWASDRGPGVQSRPLAGGAVETSVAAPADQLAIDGGVVVRTPQGFVAEQRDGDPLAPRWFADRDGVAAEMAPVAADGWIYLATTPGTLLAVPRDAPPIPIAAPAAGIVVQIAADGDALYWTEIARDASGGFTVARANPAQPGRTELATSSGWPRELAAGGGRVYLSLGDALYQLPARGGDLVEVARADEGLEGITVHRRHLYWIEGRALVARPRAGGESVVVARDVGDIYAAGSDLVFDDDHAYLTSFDHGVYQIGERGEAELLFDATGARIHPLGDLARIGDDLFFTAIDASDRGAVWKLSPAGEAAPIWRGRPDAAIADMASGADRIYVLSYDGDDAELVRIEPSGDSRVVLRWLGHGHHQAGQLAADGRGVYVAIDALEAIVQIPHDAPARSAPR